MSSTPSDETVPSTPAELAQYLSALASEVKALVGPASEQITASYLRGRKSATPPQTVHRLGEALVQVSRSISALEAGRPAIDLQAVIHLLAARELFNNWKSNAQWTYMQSSFRNADNYRHSICLLAAAMVLAGAGNSITLEMEAPDVRTADIHVTLGPADTASAEVKCPRSLDNPSESWSVEKCNKVVRRALRRAGSGHGGQLSGSGSTLLILGGLSLSESRFAMMRAAVEANLMDRRAHRPKLLGVVLVSVGAIVEGNLLRRGNELLGGANTAVSVTLSVDVVNNPLYQGSHGLDTSHQPGLRYAPDEVAEYTIPTEDRKNT